MAQPIYRHADLDLAAEATPIHSVPGKMPVTARLSGRSQIIFRVESAEAARELVSAFGPRDGNGVAAASEVAVARAAASSGQALPVGVRDRFESSLGADLSGVRVHTGGASAEAAGAVGAKAYTVGQDIHFGAGHYDPSSAFGVHLLAHEVAHTVQQQGSTPSRQHMLEVSTPRDAAELEADRAADAMVQGNPASLASFSGLARKLHRDDDEARGADHQRRAEQGDPQRQERGPSGLGGQISELAKEGATDAVTAGTNAAVTGTNAASKKSNAVPRVTIMSPYQNAAFDPTTHVMKVKVVGTPGSTVVLYMTLYSKAEIAEHREHTLTVGPGGEHLEVCKMNVANDGARYALHARASSQPGVFSPLRVVEFRTNLFYETEGGGV